MYANVDDPDNDDIIIDIYVGRSATVNSRATAAAVDFNTEHTWPQSRGANEEPAQSDINILFSADEISNSVRLNYPFGVVTGSVDWTSPAQPGITERRTAIPDRRCAPAGPRSRAQNHRRIYTRPVAIFRVLLK